jgi:glycosyltransferase involved in cell wall biosynthesis
LRIALDMRFRTRSGGVSYINNIVPALLAAQSTHEFVLLRFEGQELPMSGEWPSLVVRRGSSPEQAIWDQARLPQFLKRAGIDLYHPLKLMGTAFPICPQVTVAHAIAQPFKGEFPYTFSQRFYWQTLGTRIFRRSAAIIAVSNYVRDFLLEVIRIPAERITVINHGIDVRFRRLGPDAGGTPADPPYLLTVGNIFPVKNFLMAVKILAALAKDHPTLRLKMAGSTSHPHFQELKAAVDAAALTERVDYLGFVPPEKLVELMNAASLLLAPSLTEGFSLTLLEGLACGVPTLASSRGGIPEVGGDAIRMIEDPYDEPAFIAAARELLENPALAAALRDASLRRAKLFTWEETAKRTLAVYDTVKT